VFRWDAHHGEEPVISGTRGSGTVFFGRCTLRCLYCQNYPWSQEGSYDERVSSVEDLCDIFRELAERGCHNWNLASPTPWLPWIREALDRLKSAGVQIPVVYNSSGFEREETLRRYGDMMDIYLVDLRYALAATAREGSDAEGYVDVARRALIECRRQAGALTYDEHGVATSGLICRILVLPGHADEAIASLRWIADTLGIDTAVSVMSQYTPTYRAVDRTPWDRRVTTDEYARVQEAVGELGFTTGWVQDMVAPTPTGLIGFEMTAGDGQGGVHE